MSVIRDLANQAEYGAKEASMMSSQLAAATSRPSTLSENLEARRTALEYQLSKVNAALDALKANPNFEEMINLLSQVG